MKITNQHSMYLKQIGGQLFAWSLYACASVWYHAPDVEASAVLWLFVLYIPVFYGLVRLIRGLVRKQTRRAFVMYALAGLAACYGAAYLLIYLLLPRVGISIHDSEVSFTWADFLDEVSVGLFRWVGYASLYVVVGAWWKTARQVHRAQETGQRWELRALGKELTAHTQLGLMQHWQGRTLEEGPGMQDYAVGLAAVYDYQLRATQLDLVPLSIELEEASRVAQMLRPVYFSQGTDWLHVETADQVAMEDTLSLPVPPMTMVSLLENACKYGDLSTYGNLRMHVQGAHQALTVVCTNKIGPARPWLSSRGIGQRNLARRLELLFPGRASLHSQRIGDQFHTTLKITYDEKV